jgi:hypothetical protein
MNLAPVLKSAGKALSKVDWAKVGKVSKDLAAVAVTVWGLIGNRPKPVAPKASPSQPIQSKAMDENVSKMIIEQSLRILTLESEIDKIQTNGEAQAKVVSGIAEQMSTLADLLQTLSVRLNIFIGISAISFCICLWLLIRTFVK